MIHSPSRASNSAHAPGSPCPIALRLHSTTEARRRLNRPISRPATSGAEIGAVAVPPPPPSERSRRHAPPAGMDIFCDPSLHVEHRGEQLVDRTA